MKRIASVFLLVLLVVPPLSAVEHEEQSVVLVSDSDIFYSLIAAPLAYMKQNPLLLFHREMRDGHAQFLDSYGADELVVVGGTLSSSHAKKEFPGTPAEVSLDIARHFYDSCESVLLIPYNMSYYSLSLIATPIACYRHAPLIVYDHNDADIRELLDRLEVRQIICVGNVSIEGFDIVHLSTDEEIYDYLLTIHPENPYMVLANPKDAHPPSIVDTRVEHYHGHMKQIKITVLSHEITLFGNDTETFFFDAPEGIYTLRVYVNVTGAENPFPYMISAYLYHNDSLVTYSFSNAYERQRCYMEVPSIYVEGQYRLVVKLYHGIKGGFFIQRGLSIVDTDFDVDISMQKMSDVHHPRAILSPLAPYLACFREGIVVSAENEVTTKEYENISSGMAGGPWNNPSLHPFINTQVNKTVDMVRGMAARTDSTLVAILGDTVMIPQYYYASTTGDAYVGFGIPSDMPYSLNASLGVGRIVAWDGVDASLLISRSIFYDSIAQGEWLKNFTFITGEGFGETAGIFHQIPYSREMKNRGFDTALYGIFRNGRGYLENQGAFQANFVEYEGHGDWYWMLPSVYGLDYYSRVVDVAHVREYRLNPNVILTAACLMGRLDGIPLESSIAMAFIHAGANAFIGATRETGAEATLELIENAVIYNRISLGRAVVFSNQHTEPPTRYARVLYGDPAFVPYVPE